jgi:hypothetical protein
MRSPRHHTALRTNAAGQREVGSIGPFGRMAADPELATHWQRVRALKGAPEAQSLHNHDYCWRPCWTRAISCGMQLDEFVATGSSPFWGHR